MKHKTKKVCIAFLPVVLIFMLSACTVFDVFSVDSLIRSPKLTGDYAEVQKAFEEQVGKDISLINPLLGDFRSAYVLYDYNKDGCEETVVFYKKKEAPDEVRMHILENKNGAWRSVCDIAGNGSEVNKIEFINLDKDPELELAVTWNLSDSKRTKTLTLYKIFDDQTESDNRIIQMAVVQLTDYLVLDIDYDGQNEVFYTSMSISGDISCFSASLFRIDAESYYRVPLSEINIARNIDQILGFKTDMKDALYTVYIDCVASDGRYFTELLCYDYGSNSLFRPVDKNGALLSSFTFRSEPLLCSDINGDYMIEIPEQTEFSGSYYQTADDMNGGTIYVTSYRQLFGNELRNIASYYRNVYQKYSIKIDSFIDSVYIVYNAESGVTEFRLRNCETENDLLFSVLSGRDDISGFYAAVTPLGDQMSFSQEDIIKLIDPF